MLSIINAIFGSDNVNGAGRSLTVGMALATTTSIESCTSACFTAGYKLSGTEFGDECCEFPILENHGRKAPVIDSFYSSQTVAVPSAMLVLLLPSVIAAWSAPGTAPNSVADPIG